MLSLASRLPRALGCTASQLHLTGGLACQQAPASFEQPVAGLAGLSAASLPSSSDSTPQQLRPELRWLPDACSTSQPVFAWPVSTAGSSLQQLRGFAAGVGAPKGAKVGGMNRRSHTRLYGVRNSKLRSSFEQIWPTMRLTEEESQLFKRNSRVFVTDLGKNIPMTTKFELARATQDKVPHQDARSMLYESDLHLDAVGEHPRFLKIRRLRTQHANKLQSVRKLRVLQGFARRYMLQELYELSLTQPGPDRVWKFICAMESKLPNVVLRMGLANDILNAKDHISNSAVAVNGCREPMPHASHVQPADVVGPNDYSQDWFKGFIASHMGKDMRAAVNQSFGMSNEGANLSGPRRAVALSVFAPSGK